MSCEQEPFKVTVYWWNLHVHETVQRQMSNIHLKHKLFVISNKENFCLARILRSSSVFLQSNFCICHFLTLKITDVSRGCLWRMIDRYKLELYQTRIMLARAQQDREKNIVMFQTPKRNYRRMSFCSSSCSTSYGSQIFTVKNQLSDLFKKVKF